MLNSEKEFHVSLLFLGWRSGIYELNPLDECSIILSRLLIRVSVSGSVSISTKHQKTHTYIHTLSERNAIDASLSKSKQNREVKMSRVGGESICHHSEKKT